jgi:hypothetical protein
MALQLPTTKIGRLVRDAVRRVTKKMAITLMPPESRSGPDTELVEGKYANYLRVGHNAFEFIMEFAQVFAEAPGERVHTRIITSPAYAREMLRVLQRAVAEYEETFGTIPKNE